MKNLLQLSLALLILLTTTHCALPTAKLTAPREVRAGEVVNFENNSEEAISYSWEFGDGESSTETAPSHRFLRSGDLRVSLTATNEKGKSKTTSEQITVLPPSQCLIYIETPEGNMIAELYDETPLHQDNFVKLVEEGFFDSLLFHRVIKNFMIQSGDPNSRGAGANARLGSGSPGYTIPAEFNPGLVHLKGALAAARTNNPDRVSSGSQFYIVHGREVTDSQLNQQEGKFGFRYSSEIRDAYIEQGGTPFLDMDYTVFGRIIEGLDIVDKIAGTATRTGDRPAEDMWMVIKLIR